MDELFGLSMTYIAIACGAITAVILLFIALIAVRNPVMFKMGLRNIPRRKAQTALIVVGLMLSTLIMSAAFGTGDTLTNSVTAEVYDILGEADEIIEWDTDRQPAAVEDQVVPLATVAEWRQQLADDENIEAIVPFLVEQLPVQNTRTRLNEAAATIVAFQPEDAEALGGLRDVSGTPITLSGTELAVNEELAEAIDAQVGDTVLAFFSGEPVELTVKAIVPDQALTGALNTFQKQGGAVDFNTLAEIAGKGENADIVLVSNVGGVRDGLDRGDAVVERLETMLEDTPYKVTKIKQDNVELAELLGNAFTTIFVVFGLFSMAAGVLLIFLIFVMLAAERKPEMGMARAVGAKRRQLVESFLAEGMGYDLGSAVVGLFAGMGVTLLMVLIVTAYAGDNLGLNLSVSFTLRSLIVAFCIGVIATFLVIFISSWRASRLNITAAIRDLPETHAINPEAATWRGYVRAVLNGVIAMGLPIALALLFLGPVGMVLGLPLVLIGLISPWIYLLRGSDAGAPRAVRLGEPAPRWPWILGLALPFVGWLFVLPWYFIARVLNRIVRDRKPASAPTWLVVAGILVPPLGFVVVLLQRQNVRIAWSAGIGGALGIAGVLLTIAGLQMGSQFPFYLGVSLVFLCVAVTLQYFRIAPRFAFTVTSALLLLLWYLPSSVIEPITGELNGDIEMFFLSGMVMVTAAVFIVVYNADIVLPAIARIGSNTRILPAIRTGIAYPLTSRFRTGMTMIMIGLIMFSLIMMSTMNHNFTELFLSDDTKGGFDVVATINSNNPIDDIDAALAEAGIDTAPLTAAGELRVAYPFEAEVENVDGYEHDGEVTEFSRYTIYGADQGFLASNGIPMKFRAAGYETDRAVWDALANDPTLAVVNAAVTAAPDPFAGPMVDDPLRLDPLDEEFEPFTLRLRDPGTGTETEITVIGQMKESADVFLALGGGGLGGIVTSKETLLSTFPGAQGQTFLFSLQDGTDAEEYARQVESGLVQASVESLEKLLDEQQALQTGFLLVFQGFMGLGLIVGIAALAVVASRAVVERRQQIGMLRAIGYQRGMVALSFLFESGFIAVSGILIGLTLGLSLSWALFTTGDFGEETRNVAFTVPWLNIVIICGIAFVASMVMTFLPARTASRVPVAEALRYE